MRELDLFGRRVHGERTNNGWAIHHPGAEGKRGPPLDLPVPYDVTTHAALADYLANLCHEWSSPAHPNLRWVERGE